MTRINWVVDPGKFMSREEVRKLIRSLRDRARAASARGHKVAVRDYFVIDLALSTGLRVMEIASLKCGDIFLEDGTSSLIVRSGKGNKRRVVRFNGALRRHCEQYLRWKTAIGEPTDLRDPLVFSSNTRGHMTTRALQKIFKRALARSGVSSRYTFHCQRHTYASHLYKASGYNLRLVQKQLGHSSVHITEVYADVMNPDLSKSLSKLYA